jgi:beta-glucanase (GH16 family)
MRIDQAALTLALVACAAAGCARDTATKTTDIAKRAAGEAPQANFLELFAHLDGERWLVSDGWSNGDWMANDFLASQVETGPEGLAITMDRVEGREKRYASGEIRTIGERFHHGYYEIDMQVPRGSGIVSGFFTYTGSFFGDPHDEIDIEILGRNTREVTFTIFSDDEQASTVVPLGFDAAAGFHLYAFEWTEDYIRWYVDGELKHEETGERVPLPQTPQIYYLDLWGSENLTDWVGPLRPDGAPWTLRVRCMAYAESYEGAPHCRPS